jgi:2-C-methyl-D-erythritol 4-phosphate cytidylyltransferase
MGELGVVVVAAGKGSRMRTDVSKQYLPLAGKPVLVHTLEIFQRMAEVGFVALVVGAGEGAHCRQLAEQYGLSKVKAIVTGGAERQTSVYKGLKALPGNTEWVLVHDGVRPFVTPGEVLACWRAAREKGAAVLAVPAKETIKVVDADNRITSTPDRKSLWAMHTPQAFRLPDLMRAHEQAAAEGFLGTDDAMLAERAGLPVYVVEGSYGNIKITTPEDLEWAEWRLRNRGEMKS